jgi:hypothetical protein
MRIPGITGFYPAAPGNYTKGRVSPITDFTVHHSAGWEQTLRYLWADEARDASSTFYVSGSVREQYVDTDDTPWTNGNLASNRRSITCEVRGDWRNGYYDAATLKNLEEIMYQCLKIWPNLRLTYHMDVSDRTTLCPADLKHKGYAADCWAKAKARLATKPTPDPSPITYKKITPKRIQLIRNANLWNFNFSDWNQAKAVQSYAAGYVIDVVAVAKNSLGGEYYMTAYSYDEGRIRATNGFNVVDTKDYVPAAPVEPPKPTPKWEPLATPRKMRTLQDLYVYDLDNNKNVGDVIKKGTDVELVEKINNGVVYVRSKWARDNNKNWGIRLDQMGEIPAAPEPPVEPVPERPIDTDPTTPGKGDVEQRLSALEKIVQSIVDFLKGIFTGFKG